MVNPGSFPGSRGDFLLAQTQLYAEAVKDNHINDTLADIQRRFFKRYPVMLEDGEEPSEEWLAQVDDNAPDTELRPPNVEGLNKDAAEKAMSEYSDLISRTKFKKDQIKRRLHYIYSKNKAAESDFDKVAKDPIANITSKLLGVELKLPCKRTAYNVWGLKHRAEVDPVFQRRVEELGAKKEQHAAIRSATYKELFESLPADTQNKWIDIAACEHKEAVAEVKKRFKNSVSSSPEDRQRVIAALPRFIEPILDAIGEYTGWKSTFIAGGPELADGGRLNMISIHSGLTVGPVKMDFGCAQKSTYKKHIAPAFGTFLKMCYTVQDCKASALPSNHSSVSISDIASEDDVAMQIHTFESDAEHESMHKPKRLFEEIAKSGKSTKTKPPTGTPSPLIRFGPPLGKKKDRIPPFKDAAHVKLGPSPLSQTFTAPGTSNTSPKSPAGSSGPPTGASREVSTTTSEDGVSAPSTSPTKSLGGVATAATSSTAPTKTNEAATTSTTVVDATPLPLTVPGNDGGAALESDAEDRPATVSTTALNAASFPSTVSRHDDSATMEFNGECGRAAVSTATLDATPTTLDPAPMTVLDVASKTTLDSMSTTALDATSLPSLGATSATTTALDAAPTTAVDVASMATLDLTPLCSLYAASTTTTVLDGASTTGVDIASMTTFDAALLPSLDAASTASAALDDASTTTLDATATMALDVTSTTALDTTPTAAFDAASTVGFDAPPISSTTSEDDGDTAMELDVAPSTISENSADVAMEFDIGSSPGTRRLTTLDAPPIPSTTSEDDGDAAMELDVQSAAAAPVHSTASSAASHTVMRVNTAVGPATPSAVAFDATSNPTAGLDAAEKGLSAAATTPAAAGIPPHTPHAVAGATRAPLVNAAAGLFNAGVAAPSSEPALPAAPAKPAPFTAIASTSSILQALERASKARKGAAPLVATPSAATTPLTSPLNLTAAAPTPLLAKEGAGAKHRRTGRPTTTRPTASVPAKHRARGLTAAARRSVAASESSPPSRPASLPPSPQGLPVQPATTVKYSGAAVVPDPSDVDLEVTPAKGRKRKASHAGKENSSGHASKRAKTTSEGPSRKRRAGEAGEGRPSKRQCTGIGSHSFKVAVPTGWAASALTLLTSKDLGPQWHLLLEAWLVFEEGYGFNKKRKPYLSSSRRPDVVGQWIKRGRSTTWRPDAGTCDNFESEFNVWWRSLQPGWRIEDGGGLTRAPIYAGFIHQYGGLPK